LYIEFDGSFSDPNVEKALENLKEFSTVSLLGSFPRYQPPVQKLAGAFGIGM
jgi:prephenate dehydratase